MDMTSFAGRRSPSYKYLKDYILTYRQYRLELEKEAMKARAIEKLVDHPIESLEL